MILAMNNYDAAYIVTQILCNSFFQKNYLCHYLFNIQLLFSHKIAMKYRIMGLKSLYCSIFFILFTSQLVGQVTIGSSKEPLKGALLMLDDGTTGSLGESAKKGLGLPRVELQAYDKLQMGTTADDLTAQGDAHIGLLVYNIADDSKKCVSNYPTTGLYVWNGEKWEDIHAALRFKPIQSAPGPDVVYAPNSYIATSGSSVTIPIEKAFAIWDWWGGGEHPDGKLLAETSASFGNTLYVKVLWEESEEGVITSGNIIESVSFSSTSLYNNIAKDRSASIYVRVKAGAVGNAVVAVSDNPNVETNARWSWHIWVPKTDPTVMTYTHNAGKQTNVWMDRNLGASRNGIVEADRVYTIGMTYQWGRKDPLPTYVKLTGQKTVVPVDVQSTLANVQSNNGDGKATGLLFAINKPLSFIRSSTNSYDWYSLTNSQWNGRWGDAINECDESYRYKSETDPCPEGWQVPKYVGSTDADSPWAKEGVSSTTPGDYTNFVYSRGYYFTNADYNIGWYPTAGFRNHDSTLYDVGIHGDYWSASPNGHLVRYFNVNVNAVRPYSLHRAYSFTVRCVKE